MGVLAGLTASQAMLAGAGVTAGTGILGSIGTNISNKNIAQQNNEFNERMLQKQMDYNTEMYERQLSDTWKFYNDQKEYNSASSQVQRYRDAGINPQLAMSSSGSAGSVSSVTSPSAQGINTPSASPYTADYNSIGQSVGQAIQIYNELKNSSADRGVKSAEEKQLNIENKYKAQQLIADINQTLETTKDTKVKRMMQEQLKRVYGDMLQIDMDTKTQGLKNMREAFTGAVLDNAMKRLQLDVYPQQVKLQLAQSTANIAQLVAQKQLTLSQAKTELFKQAESSARSAGIRISNYQLKKTVDNLIEQVRLSTIKMYNNTGPDGAMGFGNLLYQSLNGNVFPDVNQSYK